MMTAPISREHSASAARTLSSHAGTADAAVDLGMHTLGPLGIELGELLDLFGELGVIGALAFAHGERTEARAAAGR